MQRSYASDGCLSLCVCVCVREARLNPVCLRASAMFHTYLCVRVGVRVCVSRVGSNCVACTHATIDHSTVRGVTVPPGDGRPAARRALVSLSEVSRCSKMSVLDIWHSSRTSADTTNRLVETVCISLCNLMHFTKIPGCMKFVVKICLFSVSFVRPAALLTTTSDM